MSKHPNISKVREYLIESGYPEDGDALLSQAAVEAELESKATIESALTKAEAVAWREFSAWVRDMPTSAGMEHWVCVGYGNTHAEHLTTNVFKTRGHAEYEVAEWNHLFGRCDKPDILAFDTDGPPDVPVESLAADCTRSLPGRLDDTTYQQIENALDLAAAPMRSASGEWLTLAERVAAIKPAESPASVSDGWDVLAAFDEAVEKELPRISELEFNSKSICTHFAKELRFRLSRITNQEGAAP